MDLQARKNLLIALGKYLSSNDENLTNIITKAEQNNAWFTDNFTRQAIENIAKQFLTEDALNKVINQYHLDDNIQPKTVGVVMAGNIPLVGFHDFLMVFLSGHKQVVKLSSKDNILLKFLTYWCAAQNPNFNNHFSLAEQLKNCDAYIATGSNNTGRYFEYYFGKYPSIIRKTKTSVAVLTGSESIDELEQLANDVHQYFGFGCRNVTKIFVPENYDFVPLLKAFDQYKWFEEHNKYKNNYDYQLSLLLLNNEFYMTNGATLVTKNKGTFSPVSHLFYDTYASEGVLAKMLENNEDIQCIVGKNRVPFGAAQCPEILDYADGVDTMQFLLNL